jgi:hypothetical protein
MIMQHSRAMNMNSFKKLIDSQVFVRFQRVGRCFHQEKFCQRHLSHVRVQSNKFLFRSSFNIMLIHNEKSKGKHNDHSADDKWKECWKCGTEVTPADMFCKAPKCGVIQAIQTESTNFFDAFNLPVSYQINEKELEYAFKELQKKLHPDKFATSSNDVKKASTQSSAAINYAYQVLDDI